MTPKIFKDNCSEETSQPARPWSAGTIGLEYADVNGFENTGVTKNESMLASVVAAAFEPSSCFG